MLIELSGKTGINEITIREEFRKIKGKKGMDNIRRFVNNIPASNKEEHLILSVVIAFPEKVDYVMGKLDLKDLHDKDVASLVQRIASVEDKKNISNILDEANEQERVIYTKLSVDPGFDFEYADKILEDCFRRIEKKKFDERLRIAQLSGDVERIHSLLLERKKL
jgi:DNA primase